VIRAIINARETWPGDDGTEIRAVSIQPRWDTVERGWMVRHYHAQTKDCVCACIGCAFRL